MYIKELTLDLDTGSRLVYCIYQGANSRPRYRSSLVCFIYQRANSRPRYRSRLVDCNVL